MTTWKNETYLTLATIGNDSDDTAFIKKSYWKVSVQYLFLVLTTTVPRPLRAVPALYIIQAA